MLLSTTSHQLQVTPATKHQSRVISTKNIRCHAISRSPRPLGSTASRRKVCVPRSLLSLMPAYHATSWLPHLRYTSTLSHATLANECYFASQLPLGRTARSTDHLFVEHVQETSVSSNLFSLYVKYGVQTLQ
ncbi:hypothetical protein HanRHA438_Chr13g0589191 [Helianthus annuus]|nr:hypothetical protein HanRHA438_Chr13g0589191 [Helianthus annuus]